MLQADPKDFQRIPSARGNATRHELRHGKAILARRKTGRFGALRAWYGTELAGSADPGGASAREITERVLKAKGVADPSQKQLRDLIGGVQSSLCNHKGRTVTTVGESIPARWALME